MAKPISRKDNGGSIDWSLVKEILRQAGTRVISQRLADWPVP